jgi:hypothetical protein
MSISAVALATYIPVTMMLRVEWQAFQHDLNIIVSPIHLLVTTVFHVTIVVLKKSVLFDSELAFSFTFMALIAAFLAYFIWMKP